MSMNMIIQEAVGEMFKPAPFVAEIKKLMNTCKLTRFKSVESCMKFYDAFFIGSTSEDVTLSFKDWAMIYRQLMSDDKFRADLAAFMVMYQPTTYVGIFNILMNQLTSDLNTMRTSRIQFLSDAKALFRMLREDFDGIMILITAQINDPDGLKFATTVNGVLTTHINYINTLIQAELKQDVDKTDVSYVMHTPLDEDVREILYLLEHGDAWMKEYIEHDTLDEAVVSNIKHAAQALKIKEEKASRAFDEFIMKKVRAAREKRRNRKHAEMVGEALRINHELKRLLKSLGLGMINPALGVIHRVVTTVIDRSTDRKDRDILLGQIKDELEIIEEKIQMAERNGDDKGKIELIRYRQRMQKEYQRINKFRFDPQRLNR